MHRRNFHKRAVAVILVILSLSALTGAAERDMLAFQGIVMSVDLKKQSMVVNERVCIWNRETIINNEKGMPAALEQLKVKNWIYVEGVYEKAHHRVLAKTIYLLPKYVDEKEKGQYPFIK